MVFTRSITTLELITSIKSMWEHSDQRYVTLFSRSMIFVVSLLFLNIFLSAVIDLEGLGQIYMHPTGSKA